jgi:hypothetical protein
VLDRFQVSGAFGSLSSGGTIILGDGSPGKRADGGTESESKGVRNERQSKEEATEAGAAGGETKSQASPISSKEKRRHRRAADVGGSIPHPRVLGQQ